MPDLKVGALSRAEIQAVWEGSVDKGYSDSLIAAGEGNGFEAWTQLFAQLERASEAVDVTTQAMFTAPWSGQSNPPAAGGARATVTLTLTRSRKVHEPLLLEKGQFVVLEETTDFGPGAGITVQTGRKYKLTANAYFAPGEKGPIEVTAEAERFGYGYNNPRAGTLKAIEQKGSLFTNDRATVTVVEELPDFSGVTSKTRIRTWNEPDMFVPDHTGQYVFMLGGDNAAQTARITVFESPKPPLYGSSVQLELFRAVGLSGVTGDFVAGERISVVNGGDTLYARVVDFHEVDGVPRLAYTVLNGADAATIVGATITGIDSGATATLWSVDYANTFTEEAPVGGIGGAEWRILDWAVDWGIVVTNVLSPSGGKSAMLDELGSERAIGRSPGEPDDVYRRRLREVADVVCPNAIKRTMNRTVPGLSWCLREVGLAGLPGFFFDGNAEGASAIPHGAVNDAYDYDTFVISGTVTGTFQFQEPVQVETTDFTLYAAGYMGRLDGSDMTVIRKSGMGVPSDLTDVRVRGLWSGATLTSLTSSTNSAQAAGHRYHLWLDYIEFRAFFLITMQGLSAGEFGMGYDRGGYDVLGDWGYDGYPWEGASIFRRVYDAINAAHAGGVSWELRIDGSSCP